MGDDKSGRQADGDAEHCDALMATVIPFFNNFEFLPLDHGGRLSAQVCAQPPVGLGLFLCFPPSIRPQHTQQRFLVS
jgi:hypothetical protein